MTLTVVMMMTARRNALFSSLQWNFNWPGLGPCEMDAVIMVMTVSVESFSFVRYRSTAC